jgi:hypothetical protein
MSDRYGVSTLLFQQAAPKERKNPNRFFRSFGAQDAFTIQHGAVVDIMPRQGHDAGGGRIWHDHTWSASAA